MNICDEHPKYKKIKKKPKNNCNVCWTAHIAYKVENVRKQPVGETKIFKDKSKYSRKQKYKRSFLDYE